ncbi:hypothetical protein SGUI_3298 [Serinicoccus hydrothermalis]|uniref:Uncharacterized protein n=1 Tax=Serinicoccus hydrothermalis TaxID=1758689 RepID=A0A1B1NGZ7_9MICO|nr:hypothetical protein [Serinicoccus hydrothermalis]ANS80694.1 hypothetical protein SGUI_3298 [Serinicoccus hydrothermalis]
MSTSVLGTSPEELERAARLLREAGAQIESVASQVLGSAPPEGAWSGLAAWQATARVQAVHRVTRSAAGPPQDAAQAIARCAAAARAAADEVRRWQRAGERAAGEAVVLRAPGPPPEPHLETLWRRRLEQLDHEVEAARRRVQDVEEDFRAAQERAAHEVRRAWDAVDEARRVGDVPRRALEAVGYAWATGERVVRTTQVVIARARARWARALEVRRAALRRAARALARLGALSRVRDAPMLLSRIRLVPGPVGMVAAWFTAWSDLRDGGGYEGWRGGTTKVLAGLGLAGGVMILATPAFPVAGAVGIGLLGAYQAWSAGNAAVDGAVVAARYVRRHVPRLAAKVGAATLRAQARAVERLRSARVVLRQARGVVVRETGRRISDVREAVAPVLAPLRDPRHRVIGLPPGGPVRLPSRELVDGVVGRLPSIEPVRDWWRRMGDPILMPVVPLPPRLPVPVELGRWRP